MKKNYLLDHSLQLSSEINALCKTISGENNAVFQIKKSATSVFANIREANYGQSMPDMISKFEIALKEVFETEGWLDILVRNEKISVETFKKLRNLCGRIRRLLISSVKTLKSKINQ